MASALFHSLRSTRGKPDAGLWCRGCRWAEDHEHSFSDETIRRLVPTDMHPRSWYRRLALCEWPTDGFLDHARSCYGVERMEFRAREGVQDIITDRL